MRAPFTYGWLRQISLICMLAIGGVSTASAQNFDAAHQVRSGVFAQWGLYQGEGLRAGVAEEISFRSLAVGFTAGIEYVRKSSWSYGIELDGRVQTGEDELLTSRYRPNLGASLRVRAGRHLRPDLYWYGTVGAALLAAEIKTVRFGQQTKITHAVPGVVMGTGIERDFGPGLFFAEYLYTNYSSKATEVNSLQFEPNSHVFRIGVKYKVGHDHYADDVLERLGDRMRRRD